MIQYFVALLGESQGPYTIEDLKHQNITQDTLIWYEGLSDWKRAEDIEEIRTALFTPISVPQNPPAKKPSFNYGLLILVLVLIICGSYILIVIYHSLSAAGDTSDLQQQENAEIQQIKDRTLYWNQCLVNKNYAELQKLYAQEVKYYLRTVPKLEVIQNKKYILDKSPNFNQSITGEILVTRMGNNTIRVQFSKRTTLKSKMLDIEAELIFIDEAGEWKIASEQDASTADLSDAHMLDLPGGARAVGAAVGDNQIAYLIPCHRVIHTDGKTGKYRWGNQRKTDILKWEGALNQEITLF
jgi:hypothetical protein